MNRLRDRRLELGRGRVYRNVEARLWAADYRDLEGNVYGVWAGILRTRIAGSMRKQKNMQAVRFFALAAAILVAPSMLGSLIIQWLGLA